MSDKKESVLPTLSSSPQNLPANINPLRSYSSVANGNAPGGRSNSTSQPSPESALGSVGSVPSVGSATGKLGSKPEGFGLGGEDVKGSLKIHIKLDLEADVRVIARVKGDIAIGLL